MNGWRVLRTAVRGVFYSACALVPYAAVALASAWGAPS